MKSKVLPSFWARYKCLPDEVKNRARKTFRLWAENPFHPSLRFKCINSEENIWSARITRSWRVVGVLREETVTWFFIGGHDDYAKFFGS